ncbi:tetratricopeptide repeat protein [candidate division WOR-3 bacterium]|nr:tetratricopeptide repeat protein [candidate division WOR-3 bacterium]
MPSFRNSSLAVLLLTAAAFGPLVAQDIPLDALMRGGRIHYDGQRYDRAKEQFTRALDQYGATADNVMLGQIHLWLGLCEEQLHNDTTAADHFVTAMEKDTAVAAKISSNEQWQYLAWTSLISATRAKYNLEAYDSALSYALAALKVDPSKSQTYALVANIYSALKRYDDMRATAEDLLKLDAGAPEAMSLLGLYFLQKPDNLWPTPEAMAARWDSTAHYYDQAIAAYEKRFAAAKTSLAKLLGLTDTDSLNHVAFLLIEKSRLQDQSELKRYIETDLSESRRLAEFAQIAGQLFYAANNLNVASSRAGTAMLRAATETSKDTSERFRAKAETLFAHAVEYDSSDFTSLFNLGITQYQGRKDSMAQKSLRAVVEGTVVPIGNLPQPWLDSVLALVNPASVGSGHVELPGRLAETIDSIYSAKGRRNVGFSWLYFPDLRDRKLTGTATLADTAGMFLSLEMPQLMEQAYLWLGSSQTGLATTLSDAGKKDAARAVYERAIVNLLIATKLDPTSPDAFQNLGICYRETDQKDKALRAFETADKLRKGR